MKDADGEEFAESSKILCEEWYPEINAALFGKQPLPFKIVILVFEDSTGAASTYGNTIHLNSEYVAKVTQDWAD